MEGVSRVATIRGETDRGLRVLPGVDVGQAALLALTAALAWVLWRLRLPVPARAALMTLTGVLGATLALARWPPGARGQRVTVWLWHGARFAAHPRLLRGAAVAGRAGIEALTPAGLRRDDQDCRVLFCEGRDHAAQGMGALEAAQAAYLEFLHGADGLVQVVSLSTWLTEADCPVAWEPATAPAELRVVAASYRAYWREAVAGRLLRRTCAAVLAPPPAPLASAAGGRAAAETEAAFRAATERMGLAPEAVSPGELARRLRVLLGAAPSAGAPPEAGFWRVEREGAAAEIPPGGA